MRLCHRTLDKPRDTVAVLCGDQRAQFGSRVILQAVFDAGDRRAELLDKCVVDIRLGVNAARGRAVLAGVIEAKGANAFHGGIDVRVVEDDHRRFAAQLHVHAFHAVSGAGNDIRAGGDGAGQRHHAHFRVVHQWAAHGRPTTEH